MSKSKAKIIETAIQVLSVDDSASLEDIADAAGVSRMTLHRNFHNRETLFKEIHEALIQQTLSIFKQAQEKHTHPVKQMEDIIKTHAGVKGFVLLMKENREHEDHDPNTCKFSEVNKALRELIQRLRDEGLISPEIPNSWVFHMYDGILYTAWETMYTGSVAPKEIPRLAWSTFRKGLLIEQ
ncbi:TetR/AcrR family transcriptional regulator [Paenibacillus sp. F411]|uniref:TetR/AcrR family transcriptional regulator n=1 Tax=Paenibacillus sp. F411 TaxID=2820239 RepID=UPI001AAE7F08|nr:TetR/AcrR family transcriptional regulator [Paenibacillus sp. F411]MBO2942427.1 TetR/AcrR family transcriptional regulator [Paenibacillus sp. F411]